MTSFCLPALITFTLIFFSLQQKPKFEANKSEYYQEKYFRFLSNNYDTIDQGDFWTTFNEENGLGFKAKDDFGSFILVKDWAMHSMKLTKIIFRPECSYGLDGETFDAEMLLIHTLDNGYYPPGKRMHLDEKYLIISVPFKKSSNFNPANDKLFEFMSLELYENILSASNTEQQLKVSPIKPIKLHQIIQHQPSYLFSGTYPGMGDPALYLIYTQFHFISEKDLEILNKAYLKIFGTLTQRTLTIGNPFYRNWQSTNEMLPKATLMAYNTSSFLKISTAFILGLLIALV